MADKKTSQEVDGTNFQKDDLTRVARGGSNYKLTAEQVFSETITQSDFNTLQGNSGLIPQRTYKVTQGLGTNADYYFIKAIDNVNVNNLSVQFNSSSVNPLGDAIGAFEDFASMPVNATDLFGNFYLQPYSGGALPNFNTGNFQGCYFDGNNGLLTITNQGYATGYSTEFLGGTYDTFNLLSIGSKFVKSTISNSNSSTSEYKNVRLYDSNIVNDLGGAYINYLTNVELLGSTLQLIGNDNLNISNCRFENCVVVIKNNATVDGLTIIGTADNEGNLPTYVIDGAYQNRVINNWAGTVISGLNGNGTSTVRARLLYEQFSADQGVYDENGTVYLINDSPIGVYEFNEYTVDTGITLNFSNISDSFFQKNHKIKLKWGANNNLNTIAFIFLNSISSTGSSTEIISYHGQTIKVGQILSFPSYLEIFSAYEYDYWGGFIWFANWGVHYDA
jgi:hypothetical protein